MNNPGRDPEVVLGMKERLRAAREVTAKRDAVADGGVAAASSVAVSTGARLPRARAIVRTSNGVGDLLYLQFLAVALGVVVFGAVSRATRSRMLSDSDLAPWIAGVFGFALWLAKEVRDTYERRKKKRDEATVNRWIQEILREVDAGPISVDELRSVLSAEDARLFDVALNRLLEAGQVIIDRGGIIRRPRQLPAGVEGHS